MGLGVQTWHASGKGETSREGDIDGFAIIITSIHSLFMLRQGIATC
jgi:hypothetical protein